MKKLIKAFVLFTVVLGIVLALAALFDQNTDPEYITLYDSDDIQ